MRPVARIEVVVRGTVQGVGFRYFVRREASDLDLAGWVGNRADGSVEVVAEGSRPGLDRLLARLAVGPAGSIVTDVEVDWMQPSGEFHGFGVRAGGHPGD